MGNFSLATIMPRNVSDRKRHLRSDLFRRFTRTRAFAVKPLKLTLALLEMKRDIIFIFWLSDAYVTGFLLEKRTYEVKVTVY